ncbi:glycolate oxidase subunit GlcE [Primorskyibacter aestuariivivens]|uniref:glycolate oxidase subunit GlcE n=1 Tax=Primorskyibacter aestuariivivens TaxID=1888912 RepID=UPI002300F489|nr:glycolate oxidase subunit GlcE [Primorskyibacter aestuariivivens]MDA7427714.1 glycolate oxidase subunit GlcE [Primorskyibacter aestuariivivens]
MRPTTEAELAQTIAAAQGPLRIRGGGTRDVGRPVAGDILETGGLSGITLYEPGALTMVAQAGTPLAEIKAALDAENQRLAFEPGDWRGLLGTDGRPTIGGVIAANVSGPRRIQVGAARDFMLGVRFVDGAGNIIKNGGRVMKNVTGYDLVKLLCGSWGTLGVLTEVSFKVLPNSGATGVLLCEGLGDADAVRALSKALGSPYEVTGAAHLQKGMDGAPVTMIRLEGSEASVAYRTDALRTLLADIGDFTIETEPEHTAAGWRYIRDVEPFHDRDGDVWRVSVKPGDAPGVVAQVKGAEAVYDWGGGLIWMLVPERQKAETIRSAVEGVGGHATLFRASEETRKSVPVFQPQPAALARIESDLRAKFDPRSILNAGLMG